MAKQILIDCETLGFGPRSVILSFAAVAFDWSGTKKLNFDEVVKTGFHVKLNVMEQVKKYKRETDVDTMNWWKAQSEEAKKVLIASDEDMLLKDALEEFNKWIEQSGYDKQKSHIWARGQDFDFPKIQSLYTDAEMKYPMSTWMNRDIRTMIDVLTGSDKGNYDLKDGLPKSFIKHDALHDSAHDAMKMCEIYFDLSQ